ncbi:plant self-incompatibility protein S1 family [Striga asiatica]|uniref:S-protein homolog n=1 Tax=Striga asiatica TaxID=4170 RepID=A0A5A7QF23_STRAF|nr:plant self-incompatibility protein S1 family [Striga asiatica]
MGNPIPTTIIPLLFILIWAIHLQAIIIHEKRHCFFTRKFTIHITNKLPPKSDPLELHCASKDDDLGFHTLSPNQSFSWGFCENFVPNTLFFCHIWWESKDIGFESFNFEFHDGCIPDGSQCFWEVRVDGLYRLTDSSRNRYGKWLSSAIDPFQVDDDLGFHTLSSNQNFSWGFCENLVRNTLFFCHLWWESKEIEFEAFNSNYHTGCIPDGSECFWEVRSDGLHRLFYDGGGGYGKWSNWGLGRQKVSTSD